MNLPDLAVFVQAVQAGSLAAAARTLHIPPMVASRRLAALEQELAVRLLHRTTRALALTAEGEAFLPFAQAMLEDEANGRASVRPSSAGASGLLRVTASAPFGRKIVAPMIPSFMQANPDLRVDLLLTDDVVDIVALGIDLAIRIAVLRDNALVARRLAESPRLLCASPDYLARRGTPLRLADLRRHECLTVTGTTHWAFRAGERSMQQGIAGRFTANSLEALHEACLGGLGIANLSLWNVKDDLANRRLVGIALAGVDPEAFAIWAVYPTARLVPPKVRLFVAALADHLAQ